MKLTAKETIKFGDNGEIAQAGETFEMDEKKHGASIAQMIELGSVVKGGSGPAAGTTPAPEPGAPAATASTPKSGPLPEDFPGRDKLADAGITTYAKLRDAGDVTAIPGIGAATAAKIADALKD
jgi:hypothetical protein